MLLKKHHTSAIFRLHKALAEPSEARHKPDNKDDHEQKDEYGDRFHICYNTAHMAIHEMLKQSIPEALRAHDEVRLRTLRSLVTMMTNEVVAKKRKPDEFLADEDALSVLKRASSQRKDSIEQFEKASRDDLAAPEKLELAIIEAYLPQMMSREEIEVVVKAKMVEMGVTSKAEAGKFTGVVMKELKGKADGGDVKAVVDALLV